MFIYIYVCVCVCVCVFFLLKLNLFTKSQSFKFRWEIFIRSIIVNVMVTQNTTALSDILLLTALPQGRVAVYTCAVSLPLFNGQLNSKLHIRFFGIFNMNRCIFDRHHTFQYKRLLLLLVPITKTRLVLSCDRLVAILQWVTMTRFLFLWVTMILSW